MACSANRVRGVLTKLAALSALLLAGCASAPNGGSTDRVAWVTRVGGPTAGAESRRAADAAARIGIDPQSGRQHVCVIASNRPAAYSWPDGYIYLTTGLIAMLDEDELCGAISHEMGHLLGSPASGGALDGASAGEDCESRADRIGCRLMRARGISPNALAHALLKVRDSSQTPACFREGLTRRIARIEREQAISGTRNDGGN